MATSSSYPSYPSEYALDLAERAAKVHASILEHSDEERRDYLRIVRAKSKFERSRLFITREFWRARLRDFSENYLEKHGPEEDW